jgi:hypothetical protein
MENEKEFTKFVSAQFEPKMKKPEQNKKPLTKIDPKKVIIVKPIYIKENKQFPTPTKK